MKKSKNAERKPRHSPSVSYEAWKRRALRDPVLRAAYEEPSDDPFLDVAHSMTRLRIKRGWTQSRLARRVGTSQQAIARLENLRYRGYTMTTLFKVARAFGKDLQVRFA